MLQTNKPLNGHPWAQLQDLELNGVELENGNAVTLHDQLGNSLGSGIFDTRDSKAAWRRFTWAENVEFDIGYIVDAMEESVGRRAEEGCQRLVSSDADYLPGLIVELYGDVILVSVENAAVEAQLDAILEVLKEGYGPREIVVRNDSPLRAAFGLESEVRTLSGNNLKGYWIEIDDLAYRIDLLNAEKPRFYLDQREQHALVGSLCAGRKVLDGFANLGAFAVQAMRNEAESVVALDTDDMAVKTMGAVAQKNELSIEAVQADVGRYLANCEPGSFGAIVLDPPTEFSDDSEALTELHSQAFSILEAGGVIATYCRSSSLAAQDFDQLVAAAAASVGREGRIFARISQPFDFPVLLNLPESRYLKGLILQVE